MGFEVIDRWHWDNLWSWIEFKLFKGFFGGTHFLKETARLSVLIYFKPQWLLMKDEPDFCSILKGLWRTMTTLQFLNKLVFDIYGRNGIFGLFLSGSYTVRRSIFALISEDRCRNAALKYVKMPDVLLLFILWRHLCCSCYSSRKRFAVVISVSVVG